MRYISPPRSASPPRVWRDLCSDGATFTPSPSPMSEHRAASPPVRNVSHELSRVSPPRTTEPSQQHREATSPDLASSVDDGLWLRSQRRSLERSAASCEDAVEELLSVERRLQASVLDDSVLEAVHVTMPSPGRVNMCANHARVLVEGHASDPLASRGVSPVRRRVLPETSASPNSVSPMPSPAHRVPAHGAGVPDLLPVAASPSESALSPRGVPQLRSTSLPVMPHQRSRAAATVPQSLSGQAGRATRAGTPQHHHSPVAARHRAATNAGVPLGSPRRSAGFGEQAEAGRDEYVVPARRAQKRSVTTSAAGSGAEDVSRRRSGTSDTCAAQGRRLNIVEKSLEKVQNEQTTHQSSLKMVIGVMQKAKERFRTIEANLAEVRRERSVTEEKQLPDDKTKPTRGKVRNIGADECAKQFEETHAKRIRTLAKGETTKMFEALEKRQAEQDKKLLDSFEKRQDLRIEKVKQDIAAIKAEMMRFNDSKAVHTPSAHISSHAVTKEYLTEQLEAFKKSQAAAVNVRLADLQASQEEVLRLAMNDVKADIARVKIEDVKVHIERVAKDLVVKEVAAHAVTKAEYTSVTEELSRIGTRQTDIEAGYSDVTEELSRIETRQTDIERVAKDLVVKEVAAHAVTKAEYTSVTEELSRIETRQTNIERVAKAEYTSVTAELSRIETRQTDIEAGYSGVTKKLGRIGKRQDDVEAEYSRVTEELSRVKTRQDDVERVTKEFDEFRAQQTAVMATLAGDFRKLADAVARIQSTHDQVAACWGSQVRNAG